LSKICVVVPTYNEAANLPSLAEKIERVLQGFSFGLIVVDDSSPDDTAGVAERLNCVYGNIIVKVRAKKSGLGSALLTGLKVALSDGDVEWIVTLDADFSHDPGEIPRLLCAAQNADLIQGSRYVRDGLVAQWGFNRRLVSFVANLICKLVVRTSVHDSTGNFRVYSRRCAEVIVSSTRAKGFEWVVEAIAVAKKRGFNVKEVPITFVNREDGETKLKGSQFIGWLTFVVKSLFSQESLFAGGSA
jgi:dolichol-phosphate mannosyltransferase